MVAQNNIKNIVWNGRAMSQSDMMEKDTVLALDLNDNVIGSASKRESHVCSSEYPRGILHRAFSVFLFDESTGELLLQRRASSKITFPNVWTNTCCSHPLHGMDPCEVDTPEDVTKGSVNGVKYAAIRKLNHELGIPSYQLPLQKFKFLTRLHYWAVDTITHGADSPWVEHEIDYVLFISIHNAKHALTINPDPDEVSDTQWVTRDDLISNMKVGLWSPWFRILAYRWLIPKGGWWDNLKETMNGDKHCDFKTIHRFDPPAEHMGGKGGAGPYLDSLVQRSTLGDPMKKQGAYGKIKTHKESKFSQLCRLDEVFSAISLLYLNPLRSNIDTPYIRSTFNAIDLKFCDEILQSVSRSFAAVIRQLPSTMLVDVLVFYLVLRALDTIEDDMNAFSGNKEKIMHLSLFHKTALVDPTWTMDGVGEGDERRLLQNFTHVHSVYAALSPAARDVIGDIAKRMADGMSQYVEKDLGQGTTDIAAYNKYCHFVAGLVGEGLSRLFAASGLEEPSLASEIHLSDQMGLFLQKTNIIRDYLEDYVDGRAFWPQTVWKKYSATGDLGYFKEQTLPQNKEASLKCLNELVTDALELAPDCLQYLSKLRCAEIFRFCAIPQVMAIATLEKCYKNSDVFTGVVKIRKGLSCKLILNSTHIRGVHAAFYHFAKQINAKADPTDPSYERTKKICLKIMDITSQDAGKFSFSFLQELVFLLPLGITLCSCLYNKTSLSFISVASLLMILIACVAVKREMVSGPTLKSADKLQVQ